MKLIITIIIFIVLISIFLYYQNNAITVTNLEYQNSELPDAFDGFRIVQISDLHNKQFGRNHNRLLSKLKEADPDIIVVTGDLVDKKRSNPEIAENFVKEAVNIAPLYFVSGNHEKIAGNYKELKERLKNVGAVVLDNEIFTIEKNGSNLNIIGLQDIGFYAYQYDSENEYRNAFKEKLSNLLSQVENFSIILSHRPEFIREYSETKAKLVLCGHAHGGQFRLPLLGGLYAPGQGFLPEYTSGCYNVDDTTMIVSRGLGNSIFPFRMFNRPEIVTLVLRK